MNEKHLRIHPAVRVRARRLRRDQTQMEQRLWRYLRRKRLGKLRFRRQHPIGRFIVDFYCPAQQLVVEIDGKSHDYQAEYDEERTAWLEGNGYHVLRFSNSEVQEDLTDVLRRILAYIEHDAKS